MLLGMRCNVSVARTTVDESMIFVGRTNRMNVRRAGIPPMSRCWPTGGDVPATING